MNKGKCPETSGRVQIKETKQQTGLARAICKRREMGKAWHMENRLDYKEREEG